MPVQHQARGVLYVHAIPRAMSTHLEWVVAGTLGRRLPLDWTATSALPTHVRARAEWAGPIGTAAAIVSAIRPWGRVHLEVTEDGRGEREGERFALTPSLGIFRASMSSIGDTVVGEERLRVLLDGSSDADLRAGIDTLLGGAWDRELEPFRAAHAEANIRWLSTASG